MSRIPTAYLLTGHPRPDQGALATLTTQGRAVGYSVIARCGPRKRSCPSELFRTDRDAAR